MLRLVSTITKILIASLITGVVLHQLDLSANQILAKIGVTPQNLMTWVQEGVTWAIPNLLLGSMIIVPVWLVVILFRPPRG